LIKKTEQNKFNEHQGINFELLIVMQLQSKYELILTFNKAVILNQEISIFSNGSYLKCREETNVKVVAF
jgi:hypothetical protein